MSRRLPPLVAMGTVIFIITPWTGNKPKFWICGREGGCQCPSSSWGGEVEDKVRRANQTLGAAILQPGLGDRPLQHPGIFAVEALRLCQVTPGLQGP